MNLVEGTLPVN